MLAADTKGTGTLDGAMKATDMQAEDAATRAAAVDSAAAVVADSTAAADMAADIAKRTC